MLRTYVLAFTAIACLLSSLPSCSSFTDCIDPDPTTRYSLTCDGDTLVSSTYRMGNIDTRCGEQTHKTPCAQPTPTCLSFDEMSASCERVCFTNGDCSADEYCSTQAAVDGRRPCRAYLTEHSLCGEDPTHCAPGLECAKTRVPEPMDAGDLEEASADDADASRNPAPPTVLTCQRVR